MIVNIDQAIEILNNDAVVAIPTETVYGLAAKVGSKKAIEAIFTTKKRPFFDPLIVHVSSIEMAKKYAFWSDEAQRLAHKFWPGPLTIILPKKENISDMITSSLPSVGLRCPDHSKSLSLINKIETPLCAPSANFFGKTSPTSAEHVLDEFDKKVPVVDGGDCQIGIESTIIKIEENQIQILRPGMISKAQIESVTNLEVTYKKIEHIPGGLDNHYQPEIPLLLFDQKFDQELTPAHLRTKRTIFLRLHDNPALAAREIYSKLRQFSKESGSIIICEDFNLFDQSGFKALKNRLLKASTHHVKK